MDTVKTERSEVLTIPFSNESFDPATVLPYQEVEIDKISETSSKKKRRRRKNKSKLGIKAESIPQEDLEELARLPAETLSYLSKMESLFKSNNKPITPEISILKRDSDEVSFVGKLYVPEEYSGSEEESVVSSLYDHEGWNWKGSCVEVDAISDSDQGEENSFEKHLYEQDDEEKSEDDDKAVEDPQKSKNKVNKNASNVIPRKQGDLRIWDYKQHADKIKESQVQEIDVICAMPSVCVNVISTENECKSRVEAKVEVMEQKLQAARYQINHEKRNDRSEFLNALRNRNQQSIIVDNVDENSHPSQEVDRAVDRDDDHQKQVREEIALVNQQESNQYDEYPYDCSDEQLDVGSEGDVMVPTIITEDEISATLLPHTSRPRPYIDVNIYGVLSRLSLIDSGAAVCTIDSELLDEVKTKLAENGHTVPTCSSEMAVKCYGGRIIENNYVVLLNIKIGKNNVIRNLPVLVVSDTGATRGLLLGTSFLESTASTLEYKTDGTCTLLLGGRNPTDDCIIRAHMIGNDQKVQSSENIQIMPKQIKKLKVEFALTSDVETSLDNKPMILYSDYLEEVLKSDPMQVVYPKNGKMTLFLSNQSKTAKTIFKNSDLGIVSTAESITNAISLAMVPKMVHSVELSKTQLINCMCSDVLGPGVGIVTVLDKDGYNLFGTTHEMVSCWDKKNRYGKQTQRIHHRGNYVWIHNSVANTPCEITDEDVGIIIKKFPLSDYHSILIPYHVGKMINLPTMQTIQKLRRAGYEVNVAAYAPAHPMEDKDGALTVCEICMRGTFCDVLNDAEKYKVTDVKIIFPTRYGQVPPGFDSKVEGTRVARFKLWEWEIVYFLHTINEVGIIVHMPQTYTSLGDQVLWHCCTLMKYLKGGFPKAKINISVMSGGEHLLWLPSLIEAMDHARCYKDYYDASLGKSRKRKDKHAKESFDFRFPGKCGCYFCGNHVSNKVLEEHKLYHDYWGIDPILEARIKGFAKKLKKDKEAPSKSAQEVSVIDVIEASEKPNEVFQGLDQLEIIDLAFNQSFESRLDNDEDSWEEICEVHYHCNKNGKCAEERELINLNKEPTMPDKVQRGYDPADRFESKCPIENVADHADLDHLTPKQREFALKLLEKHVNVLSISSDDVRFVKNHYLSFTCEDETPFMIRPYPMSSAMQEEYILHFNNLVKRGYAIEDTHQRRGRDRMLFFSPSFLVWKNSKSKLEGKKEFRLVTDFSKVNLRISEDFRGGSIPNLDELMNCFASTRYTSIMDASNFFPSFRVTRDCQRYLGLSSPGTHPNLISTVCLLGVAIWPGLTQLASACMLRKPLKPRVAQYVDDYAINSVLDQYPIKSEHLEHIGTGDGLTEDFFEHLSILDDFLTDADYFGLLFSFKKARLFVTSFEYLGYQLNPGGAIDIPANKIKALQEFPIDSDHLTVKNVQGCIGMLNYLSQFCDSYSAKMYLLNQKVSEKTERGKKWKLDPIHKELLRELIADATKAPTRYVYNNKLPLDIYVDSSLTSMAAAIFNRDPDSGRLCLVRFASWVHSQHDIRCLPSILKELATVIKVCRSFPMYLKQTDKKLMTTIWTDQKTIQEMLTNHQTQSPNAKIARWLTTIMNMPLAFKFNWCAGTSPPLCVSDFGSRDPRFGFAYVSRFSNKLDKIPENLRPVWNGGCTSEDIRKFIKQFEIIKWPKTTKLRIPVQDQEADDWDEDDYDRIGMDYFLPKLTWPGRHPPQPDDFEVKRAGSIKTQDSAFGSETGSMIEENESLCSLAGRVPMESHVNYIGDYCNEHCINSKTLCGSSFQIKSTVIEVCSLLFSSPVMKTQFRHSIEEMNKPPFDLHQIAEFQKKDPKLLSIINKLSRKPDKQTAKKYEMFEGFLLIKKGNDGVGRIVLDFFTLIVLAAWVHLWNHAGENSTQKSLSTQYTSKYMTQIVRAICFTCTTCKWSKPKLSKKDCIAGISAKPREVWSHMAMDHVTMTSEVTSLNSDKYKFILVCTDVASRLIIPTPVMSTTADETARVLYNVLCQHPRIDTLSSDNAQGLIRSNEVKKVLDIFNIKAIHRLPSNPQSGSIVERSIQVLRVAFRIVQKARKCESWMEAYPAVCMIINTNYRRYYMIKDGRIQSLWTSPNQLAYNKDDRFQLKDIWGDRLTPLALKYKQKWKKDFQEACNAFNDNRAELQRILDEEHDSKIQKKDLVVLKRTRAEERKKSTFYQNIYKVVGRKNRKVTLKALYGSPAEQLQLRDVFVGHIEKFAQDPLVRHLPPIFQKGLGYKVPLKASNDLPEQLWDFSDTQLGWSKKAIEKNLAKMVKKKEIILESDSSTDSESDSKTSNDSTGFDRGKVSGSGVPQQPRPEFPELPKAGDKGARRREAYDADQVPHRVEEDQSVATDASVTEQEQAQPKRKSKVRKLVKSVKKFAKRTVGRKSPRAKK